MRQRGILDAWLAAEVGLSLNVFYDRTSYLSEMSGQWRYNPYLQDWLKQLPKPVGILASHDIHGVQISESCRQLGLRVPDDVAIVGVDDDDLLCDLARSGFSDARQLSVVFREETGMPPTHFRREHKVS